MGSKKSSSSTPTPVASTLSAANVATPRAETPVTTVVTPAQTRDVAADTSKSVQEQIKARNRLQGIRSTWASFNENNGDRSSKLG